MSLYVNKGGCNGADLWLSGDKPALSGDKVCLSGDELILSGDKLWLSGDKLALLTGNTRSYHVSRRESAI
ncbi:hypothetical protein SLU01_14820 [Sporosarcina luteola]|uniref:Uncharacterized protein n=1 Tax=Sporosarcina luteola TaxID=582850 RepID=A0A511Z6X4_9BACL|nr:hypothetical protein SLU01_14820 [Sporosarcina luteola]